MKIVILFALLFVSSFADEIANDEENEIDVDDDVDKVVIQDPCRGVTCDAGRECRVDPETEEGVCDCIEDCGYESDPRRRVCSNLNETFSSDCELHRLRCLCQEDDPRCVSKHRHAHIEYYGECRHISDCSGDELEDFPRRMREWLYNVMQELSERSELSSHYAKLEKEAREAEEQRLRWRNAAVWKWCDLDRHPQNNMVSRHELFPVKAPLQALEHCIGQFLDSCDEDDDHEISLREWGKCLRIEEADLIAQCEEIKQ